MKETVLTRITQEVIDLKLKAADEFIADVIEPLEKIGSPEALIGKKYESWSALDLQLLSQVYGQGNETPLAKLIFNKSLAEVQRLESEV